MNTRISRKDSELIRSHYQFARLAQADVSGFVTLMCGRFVLTLPTEEIAGWFDAVLAAQFETPRYNICPTQLVPAVVHHEDTRQIVQMRWGFIPHWYEKPADGPLLTNARSETIAQRPAFRASVQSRRCLIPASGFFEWNAAKGKGKEPWYVKPAAAELMSFAGIWQVWTSPEGLRNVTCAIVTTAAGEQMAEIHHREPVVISKEDAGLWLGEEGKGAARLLKAADDGFYVRHRVGLEVNKARHDVASLMDPLVEE